MRRSRRKHSGRFVLFCFDYTSEIAAILIGKVSRSRRDATCLPATKDISKLFDETHAKRSQWNTPQTPRYFQMVARKLTCKNRF